MQKLYCVNFYKDETRARKTWKGFRDRDAAHAFVTALGQRFIRMDIALRPVMAA